MLGKFLCFSPAGSNNCVGIHDTCTNLPFCICIRSPGPTICRIELGSNRRRTRPRGESTGTRDRQKRTSLRSRPGPKQHPEISVDPEIHVYFRFSLAEDLGSIRLNYNQTGASPYCAYVLLA